MKPAHYHKGIDKFFSATERSHLSNFHPQLQDALANIRQHGRAEEWNDVLTLVDASDHPPDFTGDTIRFADPSVDYETALKRLLPWRKGPIQIGKTYIDTEWRSDWKWRRIQPHLESLHERHVLDVGCGNGYHLYRMLGDGAGLALGIDPTMLFNYQFRLMQKLAPPNAAYLLPLKSEQLPAFSYFDTVFSMGVLYHRRSPIDHLSELLSFLRPGGQLVLETLIVEGDEYTTLLPKDRYAKMANVWFIPSTDMLERMIERVGFTDTKTVDVTPTTTDEQRATEWMQFQSLADFLDPMDSSRTVEGYPAPVRAVVTARKPS